MKTTACSCGCCEGVEKLTPMALANRPGLSALAYRAGTYATFFETMVARLSSLAIELPTGQYDEHGHAITAPIFPLTALTTRDPSDPAIALLDAWAVVADVLTFYDERLANEGYLRTATERRSVLELARLVGYALRPGVASTAYLAYTIDEDRSVTPPKGMEVTIPAGTRAQSVPEPGQLPQPFETAEDLPARTAWNKLGPRLSQPQTAESIKSDGLYLEGTATNLKPNDALLIDLGLGGDPIPVRVVTVTPDQVANRTHVSWRSWIDAKQVIAEVSVLVSLQLSLAPTNNKTADEAVALLKEIKKAAADPSITPAALAKEMNEIVPLLSKLHDGLPSNATKLEAWLRASIADLKSLSKDLLLAVTFEPGSASGAVESRESVSKEDLFGSLSKTPSVPPANASQLKRTLATGLERAAIFSRACLRTFVRLSTMFSDRRWPMQRSSNLRRSRSMRCELWPRFLATTRRINQRSSMKMGKSRDSKRPD